MAGVIEGFRWALTGQSPPPGPMMFASAAVVALVVVSGLIYYQAMEGSIADVV
jgi:lipopolysaccharide transport system permease protein